MPPIATMFVIVVLILLSVFAVFKCIRMKKRSLMKECLTEMVRLAKTSPKPFTISAGTLLGGIREGDILKTDDDVDFHVMEEDYEAVTNHIRTHLNKRFKISHFTADEMNIVPDTMFGFLTHADLYKAKKVTPSEYSIDGVVYPIDAVRYGGNITMAGLTNVPVPLDPELFLECSYGDWRTPRYLDKGNFSQNGKPQNTDVVLRIRRFFKKIGLYF